MCKARFFGVALLVAMFSIDSVAQAQQEVHNHEKCGVDHFTNLIYKNFPGSREAAEAADVELENFIREFDASASRGDEPLIIPVVFHVVHFGGDENISAEQIASQIDVLNEDFSASNPSIGNVNAAFTDIIGNVGFEFRLAKKDPDGNCTNGIVRVISDATENADDGVKTVAPGWPRDKYLNVWVVKTIASFSGTAGTILGYATFPQSVNSAETAFLDGIVIRSDRTGRIGTAAGNDPSTLSHEIGHWANLCHTWGCSTSNGLASNCNVDDEVEDTPNTIGYQDICPGNPTSCSSLDNVQNFMDYSSCAIMFTAGQSQRMNSTMNSFVAQRNSLWTQSNLEATGVLDPDVICVADFDVLSEPVICQGQSLQFNDISFNGVQTRAWSFPGGTPSTSTMASPEVTYNTPGTYEVTLTVTNANGSLSVTKTNLVTVFAPGQNTLQFTESFESFSSLEPNDEYWTVVNPDFSDIKWELISNVGYFSNQSVMVRGRSNGNTVSKEYLISPTFDLSGLSENAVLNFWYAHARRISDSDDVLRVWISSNCGDTWSLRRTISMSSLPTVPNNVTGQFAPESNDDWEEVEIDNIVSIFLTDEFRVRFEFESNRGNNIYIDYINIFDGLTSRVGDIDLLDELKIYPNPTEGETTLTYTLDKSADLSIDVLDLSGRLVHEVSRGMRSPGAQVERLDLRSLPQGMYIVRMMANGQQISKRIAVL
jgi:PKD repeat protein